jgi:Sulfotransferase domain.
MSGSLDHPDWVRRLNLFGDAVGDPRTLVPLDPDELLAIARTTTGLTDVGDTEWSGWETAFRAFITSIDQESQLSHLGRVVTRAEVTRMLQTWLRLQAHWTATPAVLDEQIDAPLFVVGPPRTGTTILLELLALDPSLRAPLAWEAVQPLVRLDDPLADRAERRRLAESEQEFWADIHPEFMTMHELASDLPCECVHFLAYDYAGPYGSMFYDTPSFTGWQLENLDTLDRVYRLHRRMLQTFQHAGDPRGPATDGTDRRWLLKSPAHVSTLPQLFAEYPDALVIHTHRDPRKFIASLVSLLGVLRFMRSDEVDVPALGPMMEITYQMFLEGAIAQRADGSVPTERIVDSHFLDLMADPVAQLHGLYDQLALDWPAGHDTRIRDYLANKPKGKHGTHSYTFESVGLDEDHVRATFANYVAHYGITEE